MAYPIIRDDADAKEMFMRLRALLAGRLNVTGEVTLATNATTTTVIDARVTPKSYVSLAPITASAATEQWHVSARERGSFTVTHGNSAINDRTFSYVLLGG